MATTQEEHLKELDKGYRFGWHDPEHHVFTPKRGLSPEVVEEISYMKSEPDWMRKFRLKSLKHFENRPMPWWGADLSDIDFQNIYYFIRATEKQAKSWEDLPEDIRSTWDRLGIPEAEKKYLGGVSSQYESEVVYHKIKDELSSMGVLFTDMDSALRDHPDIVKEYFGTIIPANDNKFAALNSAVWSGGSFIYVPPGVHVDIPLQAYFRINAENMGQFERTLIIADEGAYVHYVEGCSAPIYTTDSLHSAVVEIVVKKGARVRYTTIQNWSTNVYNLVTKRAAAYEDSVMEWIDGNIGCLTGDTLIFTGGRPTAIKDLGPDDEVWAYDLERMEPVKRRVLGLKDSGIQQVFRIRTKNHREIEATANHPFLVLEPASPAGTAVIGWKALRDIRVGDRIGVVRGLPDAGSPRDLRDYQYSGHVRGRPKTSVRLPEQTDETLMWLLGAYLGDGYMEVNSSGTPNRVYFAVPPLDRSRTKLEVALKEVFEVEGRQKGPVALAVSSTVLADFFRWLDVLGTAKTKRIPAWVWGLPVSQRLALIEGLLDTDGHVRERSERNGIQYGQLTFSSANRELLDDLRLLAISCGLNPGKISRYVTGRKLALGREVKEYVGYAVNMNLRDNLDPIRMHRAPESRLEFTPVAEIEELLDEPTYDIEVEGVHNFVANGLLVHNSKVTMKYPSIYLLGKGARGEVLSVAYAGKGMHTDAGGKAIHAAPYTTSVINSKSVSKDGGRTGYRGLIRVEPDAHHAKSTVRCDALILDDDSRSDTYPYIEVEDETAALGHEATVSKVGDDQLFYLMSRGLTKAEATAMIVNGFIEPITRELPMEYAVELNRLIELQMEGAVG